MLRTPPEIEGSYPSYWENGPERTLIAGERIVAVVGCWTKAPCAPPSRCSNPLIWKFPVSSDDTVDLSSMWDRFGHRGPSRLPLDAMYEFLRIDLHPPPGEVIPLPEVPDAGYPMRRGDAR